MKILSIRVGLDVDCSELTCEIGRVSPVAAFEFFAKALNDRSIVARHERPYVYITYLDEGKDVTTRKFITPENVDEISHIIRGMYEKKTLRCLESSVDVVWAGINPKDREVYTPEALEDIAEPPKSQDNDDIHLDWKANEKFAGVRFDFDWVYKVDVIESAAGKISSRLGRRLRFVPM